MAASAEDDGCCSTVILRSQEHIAWPGLHALLVASGGHPGNQQANHPRDTTCTLWLARIRPSRENNAVAGKWRDAYPSHCLIHAC